MIETGENLKNARLLSGISLDEVSKDINIPVLLLEQIEAGSIGSFDNIYELKQMLLDYSKYLGLNIEDVTNKFNEYMFDYTSKIPLAEIEKAVNDKERDEVVDEDVIASPYTRCYPKEKTLPYIVTGIIIIILVIIAVIWSVKKITVDNENSDLITYVETGE